MTLFRHGLMIAAAVLATAAAAQQPGPPSGKVGFVNTQRVLQESSTTKKSRQALEDKIQQRIKEIDAGPQNMIESRRIALDEEMNIEREDALRQFVEKTNRIIRHIAIEENFDAVFLEAAYFNKSIDLTDKVIKELDAGN
jgi:outer membrane protein